MNFQPKKQNKKKGMDKKKRVAGKKKNLLLTGQAVVRLFVCIARSATERRLLRNSGRRGVILRLTVVVEHGLAAVHPLLLLRVPLQLVLPKQLLHHVAANVLAVEAALSHTWAIAQHVTLVLCRLWAAQMTMTGHRFLKEKKGFFLKVGEGMQASQEDDQ
jgi:hypothetical protein